MSITTYAELQTALGNWLNRGDLTARLPEFIALAESRFRRELKDWLRFSVNLTNLTGDTVLAATVSEVLGCRHNDGASGSHNFPLRMIAREEYGYWLEVDSTARTPAEMVYVDLDADAPSTTLRFYPPASSTGPLANLKVDAVKVLPSLSDSQTTNALLREAPDAYLYASLGEAAPYLQHDERVTLWMGRANEAIKSLRILSERRLYGGQPAPRPLARVF
jgi:hypothetical protein